MLRSALVACLLFVLSFAPLHAQNARGSWILVESQQSSDAALERILVYKTFFPEVSGYQTEDGGYGIWLGPFSQVEGDFLLGQFQQNGLIPDTSDLLTTAQLGAQFYPVAGEAPAATQPPKTTLPDTLVPVETVDTTEASAAIVDTETPQQARASERALSLEAKKQLQIALRDQGFYNGAIDGIYGRGTRGSMGRWQAANGFEDTGVLTTLQRETLLNQYFAVLNGLGMRMVEDQAAGIRIEMPTNVVAFDGYTPPFAHYRDPNGSVAEVHLISQPGDRASLYALYDVMETLSIVPLDGRRKKNRNNFILTGSNDRIISHTEAFLAGGQIKGYTIVWPADQAAQAEKLIERMAASFAVTPSVLPRGATSQVEPGQDDVGGLAIRKASAVVSGVFINADGMVLTTSAIGPQCGQVTIFDDADYRVVRHAPEIGVSLLAPRGTVEPQGFAEVQGLPNKLDAQAVLAGYSFGGMLNAPTLTFGTVAASTGLQGEQHLDRVAMTHFDADIGGPVLSSNGDIMGILSAYALGDGRQLPDGVSFMTDNLAIAEFLKDAGAPYSVNLSANPKSGVELERLSRDAAVWISCWELRLRPPELDGENHEDG